MRESVEHVMRVTTRPPVTMVEGAGSWLRDGDGRQYLDFVQGWAVNCLGHSHPVMRRALEEQAARLINCSPPSTTRRWRDWPRAWRRAAGSLTCSSATAARRPTRAPS